MLNWDLNEPGDLFGDYSCFDPEKSWKSQYAFASSEKVEVLKIKGNEARIILNKINKQAKLEELMQTLREAIPTFKQRTTGLRNKLSKLFITKTFNPGHSLIQEGQKSEVAYIVKRGELKMISRQIPIVINNIKQIQKT